MRARARTGRCGEAEEGRDKANAVVCVHIRVYAAEEGGRGRDGERGILTDFAVGIGGFSAGTEVRIPPSRSTVCYFKHNPLEPTLLSSERVFITQYPLPMPNTNTREVQTPAATSTFPYAEPFSKENMRVFYVWGGGGSGSAGSKHRS